MAISIETSALSYGAGRVDLADMRDLPPGTFDVETDVMDLQEYRDLIDEHFPCPGPRRGETP